MKQSIRYLGGKQYQAALNPNYYADELKETCYYVVGCKNVPIKSLNVSSSLNKTPELRANFVLK